MQTTERKDELTSVIIKFAIVTIAFLLGCFINYLESISLTL